MARILTGIQSTGTPHLGNILGAIMPAIEMAQNPKNESFLFIADMHSLTQIKNGAELRQNTYATAATWLAFGLDIEKTVFYRQSDVPQVTELSWYLSCFFPTGNEQSGFSNLVDRRRCYRIGSFPESVIVTSGESERLKRNKPETLLFIGCSTASLVADAAMSVQASKNRRSRQFFVQTPKAI